MIDHTLSVALVLLGIALLLAVVAATLHYASSNPRAQWWARELDVNARLYIVAAACCPFVAAALTHCGIQ